MSLLITVTALFSLLILIYIIRNIFQLRSIPGPFLNRISPIPRLWSVYNGSNHIDTIHLHRKYGSVVRTGPCHVSISLPSALSMVYDTFRPFQKSAFYSLFDAQSPHGLMPTTFSIRSESIHRGMKRPIAAAYSMTTLLELENLVDDAIKTFMSKFEEKLQGRGEITIDLGEWLHWYAFDVITSVTFSNTIGFMAQERDVEGIIGAIEGRLKYNCTIGQWPVLHGFLLGNRLGQWLINRTSLRTMNSSAKIVQFAARQLQLRSSTKRDMDVSGVKLDDSHSNSSNGVTDMLDKFRLTKISGEVQMTSTDVLSAASGNVFAGSDTTAITLRAIFYFLCKSPACMTRLLIEIGQTQKSSITSFAESQNMPYLQACIKEALRMWPAVGMSLERVVPKGGVELDGHFLPEGTNVGANPWVFARTEAVYEDAEVFRPERWLQATSEKMKDMEKNFLAFGLGSRTCLGKNIAMIEISKLVPQVLRQFTVELEHPDMELKGECYFFVKQFGLRCVLRRRMNAGES